MSLKTEIIAAAVRVAANHSNLLRKPDASTEFINSLFGVESYDQRLAKDIEKDVDRAVTAVRSLTTNLKFKKITRHI